jgi:hypothetical protein
MEQITVDEPRDGVPAWAGGTPSGNRPQYGADANKITPPQRELILRLLDEKDFTKAEQLPTWQMKIDGLYKALRISEDPEEFGMSKWVARDTIEFLLKFPNKPGVSNKPSAGSQPIADGYYALRDMPGHKNDVTFYRLRTPKDGKWAGYQFIDQVVGHGKRYPQRGRDVRAKIYEAIRKQGEIESKKLYGQTIGACGRCGRELTDQTSRAFGIGPDCREQMGL